MFKILVFVFCFLVLYYVCIPFRIILKHPFKVVFYLFKDIFSWFRYRKFNIYEGGILNCYCAHFGGGKTLSLVEYITFLYKKYNNKKVYDFKTKSWKIQKVLVLSNVELSIPYQYLNSLNDIVECSFYNKSIDEQLHTRTVVLVLLDEASVQLNSRNFKSNIDAEFLNTLITCRHFNISMFYSSQKFKLTDALLRSVTQRVISCRKIWRFMIQTTYNADEVEVVGDISLVKPIAKSGFLVTDKIYNLYDTYATVEQLKKSSDSGDYLSEKEIIENRQAIYSYNEINPKRYNKKYRKFKKNN